MFRQQTLMVSVVLGVLSFVLVACWDKTEMNELALVSMVGMDSDPESGEKTIHYQIINPSSGTSAKGTQGGEQSPVYTYVIKGQTFGEIRSTIYKILPRKLFVAHYKVVVVSQRAARQGIREIVSFIELQPTGRVSVPMLIADEPLSRIMNTLTPLERVPANAIASRLKLLMENSLVSGKWIKVSDIIERMEKGDFIVLPMIASMTEVNPSSSAAMSTNIDSPQNNLMIGGGAVFQNYRMVGRLDDRELFLYHLLNDARGRQLRQFRFGGKPLSMQLKVIGRQRTVHWQQNRPVVGIHLDLILSSELSTESLPQTREDVVRLEQAIARQISEELDAFYEKTRAQGWDLLGIRDLLERSRMPGHRDADRSSHPAKVVISVNARFSKVGMKYT